MEVENPVTFLGVTFDKAKARKWEDDFDVYEWDDNLALISKKVYDHGEDVEPFNNLKYRYVILGIGPDSGFTIKDPETGEDVEANYYSAYLVPDMDFYHESKLKEVASLFGWDDYTVDEIKAELSVKDMADEGYGVFLGDFAENCENDWNEDVLNGFATAIDFIDGIRGFTLDQPGNRLGMTGWDFLEMCITDKSFKDFVPGL